MLILLEGEGRILFCRLVSFSLLTFSLSGETLRVATYNLNNYLSMDRMVHGVWQWDYPKTSKEKRIVRSVINQAQPDILAIQEIGGPAYLNELWHDLNVTNGVKFNFSAWVPPHNKEEVRHLALLSKVPFKIVSQKKDCVFKYFDSRLSPSRGLMEVELETNGVRWSIINLHLKSKWTEFPEDPEGSMRREREARRGTGGVRQK